MVKQLLTYYCLSTVKTIEITDMGGTGFKRWKILLTLHCESFLDDEYNKSFQNTLNDPNTLTVKFSGNKLSQSHI